MRQSRFAVHLKQRSCLQSGFSCPTLFAAVTSPSCIIQPDAPSLFFFFFFDALDSALTCFRLHCHVLASDQSTCRRSFPCGCSCALLSVCRPPWLPPLLSLLDIDILNTVVVLWCLSALTHFDSSPFSPPHVPPLCHCV